MKRATDISETKLDPNKAALTFDHLYPNVLRNHNALRPGIQPNAHETHGIPYEPEAAKSSDEEKS